jgi:hypothetical protein
MGRHCTSPAGALASVRRTGKLPQSAAMSIANRRKGSNDDIAFDETGLD